MTPAAEESVGRTMGRLDQLLDQVEAALREMRSEIDRQRAPERGTEESR